MSYKYETQYNSPNYTPASQTRSVWGVDRNIQHIDIHWWGDPATNPSYEGVISHLSNPNSGVSANYVATGTGRRVACLVSPNDNSWATKQDNPYSISIECDPRCRPEDYDVVAELIADIRSAYGNLSLHPHKEFVATRCPGDWDLTRLDALSHTKFSHATEWGQGGTIPVAPPVTPPVVTPPVIEPPVVPLPVPPVVPAEPTPIPVTTESWIVKAINAIIKFLLALVSPNTDRIGK